MAGSACSSYLPYQKKSWSAVLVYHTTGTLRCDHQPGRPHLRAPTHMTAAEDALKKLSLMDKRKLMVAEGAYP